MYVLTPMLQQMLANIMKPFGSKWFQNVCVAVWMAVLLAGPEFYEVSKVSSAEWGDLSKMSSVNAVV